MKEKYDSLVHCQITKKRKANYLSEYCKTLSAFLTYATS